jgi:hypothetical protein
LQSALAAKRGAQWKADPGCSSSIRPILAQFFQGCSSSIGAALLPHEIVPADFAQVHRWIEFNRDLIVDVSNGTVDAVAEEVYPRLQKLP